MTNDIPVQVNYETFEYEVQKIAQSQQFRRFERDGYEVCGDDYGERHVVRVTMDFIKSKQHVLHTGSENYHESVPYPAPGLWNALKLSITNWVPTINFGWLKPEYIDIIVGKTDIKHYDCYNIQPITSDEHRRTYGRFYRYHLAQRSEPFKWLESDVLNSPISQQTNIRDSYDPTNERYRSGF